LTLSWLRACGDKDRGAKDGAGDKKERTFVTELECNARVWNKVLTGKVAAPFTLFRAGRKKCALSWQGDGTSFIEERKDHPGN